MKPTNNDPYYRTFNRDVEAMSDADWTQHNPWRAPGAAPVRGLMLQSLVFSVSSPRSEWAFFSPLLSAQLT